MYEGNFFKALLAKLRHAGLNAYVTLPTKTPYPAIECEFLESRMFEDKIFIRFHLKIFFDTATYDQNISHCMKITKLVEASLLLEQGKQALSKKLSQKSLPREKGALFIIVQEYETIMRNA